MMRRCIRRITTGIAEPSRARVPYNPTTMITQFFKRKNSVVRETSADNQAKRSCGDKLRCVKDDASPASGPVGNAYSSLSTLLRQEGWRAVLAPEFGAAYMRMLSASLCKESIERATVIYPPAEDTFRAFELTPWDEVRVVVLGQDPYHGAGQAMGLAFSVPKGVRLPSSLRNIYNELHRDVPGFVIPKHGDLTSWARQGVLLLNTVLTVRANNANSHKKLGWELFTEAIVREINARKRGIVFLLWGRHAQLKGAAVDRSKHLVLEAAHPSGLSAHRGFNGCKHFSATNRYLNDNGTPPIDWARCNDIN